MKEEQMNIVVKTTSGEINSNFEEIKKRVSEQVEEYKNQVVTEETVASGKKDVADLRKQQKAIDTKRKEVKKIWNAPFSKFEEQCKELIAIIEEPVQLLNNQIADFVEQEKLEKQEKIKSIQNELMEEVTDIAEYIDLSIPQEWINKSFSLAKVRQAILERVVQTRQDLNVLLNMPVAPEVIDTIKSMYKSYHDFNACVEYGNNAIAKAQERERIRLEEIEKLKQQPVHVVIAENKEVEEPKQIDEDTPFVQMNTKKVVYEVVGTDEELEQVETLFNSLGIFFSRKDM